MRVLRECVFGVVVLLVLSSCASKQVEISQADSQTIKSKISRLESKADELRDEQTHILAPQQFTLATERLKQAKEQLDDGAPAKQILQTLDQAETRFEESSKLALTARTILKPATAARKEAKRSGASDFAKERFSEADERLLEITRSAEEGDFTKARAEVNSIVQAFQKAEAVALKAQLLGNARENVARAEKLDAESLVPETLAQTKKGMKDAAALIEEERDINQETRDAARGAIYQSNRLLHLTEAAEKVSKSTPEQVVLADEARLRRMSTAIFGAYDFADQTFDRQAQIIVQDVQANNAVQRVRMSVAEGRINDLSEKAALSERGKRVQAKFKPNEAKVLSHQGNVIIRLNSLDFPVGKAHLKKSNYPLLGKVASAVEMFESPVVEVQGHADATGSEKINRKLSDLRAQAVKAYFVANRVDVAKIEAKGFGASKPIASNKSKEGRELNRRVDIIIKSGE